MKAGAGKRKGSAFERDVCKKLSLWISNDTQEDVFWRSAVSGGRSTMAHAKGKRLAAQAGDISCIHPVGAAFASKFLVECKNYRDLNLFGLITAKGNLITFWRQARKDAAQYNKHPILIAKQNQQPTLICLDRSGSVMLNVRHKLLVRSSWLNLYITTFDLFLKWAVRPKCRK